MPTAEPTRLTDDLWLAAHDSVNGKPRIGDWPLGVGLAAGLLAELIMLEFLDLRQGELFRETEELPNDPALRPLLVTMAEEERLRPTPEPVRIQARAQIGEARPVAPTAHGRNWHPQAQEENRHRRPGHKLTTWISYLAYRRRAEDGIVDRLIDSRLIRPEARRRWIGRTTVRYVPNDSVAAGTPANLIVGALQRGLTLSSTELVLARLFFATGLDQHALATLESAERDLLSQRLGLLDPKLRELLRAAHAAVGEKAMR